MVAGDSLAGGLLVRVQFVRAEFVEAKASWRRTAAALLAVFALSIAIAAPAVAATPPNAALNSIDSMLKWINAYRGKPEPDGLPVLVHGLSDLQAFKDAETCGAYIGFIAGVLGANPDRADTLIETTLTIGPADHSAFLPPTVSPRLPI